MNTSAPSKDRVPLKTVQIAQWRKVDKERDTYLDITVKSGMRCLAPLFKNLMAHKAGEIDNDTYRAEYVKLMVARIRDNPENFRALFLDLLNGKESIVLACYCRAGHFCHRYILINDVLPMVNELLGIDFEYLGEIA